MNEWITDSDHAADTDIFISIFSHCSIGYVQRWSELEATSAVLAEVYTLANV